MMIHLRLSIFEIIDTMIRDSLVHSSAKLLAERFV